MVEKNLKKLKARKYRVMNGFNTGTRDMKLKTAYRRKKRWSAEDADHSLFTVYISQIEKLCFDIFSPNPDMPPEYL